MFLSEIALLIAIAVAGDSGNKLLTLPIDVRGEYIGYLYESLSDADFLKRFKRLAYLEGKRDPF